MIRITLAGCTGWVGKALVAAITAAPDLELVAGISRKAAGRDLGEAAGQPANGLPVFASVAEALAVPSDVLIDYTKPDSVKGNVLAAVAAGRHVVVGASGMTAEDYAEIDAAAQAAGIGAFAAGNFAITATLLKRFALEAARYIPDVEIVEYFYQGKPDAPSGTVRELAERLSEIRLPATSKPVAELSGVRETRGAAMGAGTHKVQVHSLRLPGFVSSCEAIFGLPSERLSIRHDSGESAAPYVSGTLLAARRVREQVGLRRGLDSLMA